MSQKLERVKDKVAFITGAGSGIGKATALMLAQEGAKVAVSDINLATVETTRDEILAFGGQATAYHQDVVNEETWQSISQDILSKWEKLDILVNNAGIALTGNCEDMSLENWRKVLSINLDGVFLGLKYCVTAMKKGSGGSIINIASAAGIKALAGGGAYCASKTAVQMLSRCVALEVAGDNIRVNSVSPGGVITAIWQSTDFWQKLKDKKINDDAFWQAMAKPVPLKRFAQAEEIAQAILYLASDESKFVTGTDLVIDGGYRA
ncbi:MAG: SDR family oxidoreductase [Acidobacteria bacterium]|nr:SDR family oxidoreductase [Acidobacteriota bacterium]